MVEQWFLVPLFFIGASKINFLYSIGISVCHNSCHAVHLMIPYVPEYDNSKKYTFFHLGTSFFSICPHTLTKTYYQCIPFEKQENLLYKYISSMINIELFPVSFIKSNMKFVYCSFLKEPVCFPLLTDSNAMYTIGF